HGAVEAQRPRPYRFQSRRGLGVPAREQGHVVTERHELFGEPVNDAFRTTVQLRRHGFDQWSNLSNAHAEFLLGGMHHLQAALRVHETKRPTVPSTSVVGSSSSNLSSRFAFSSRVARSFVR